MQAEIKNLNGDIKAKNDQIATLGKQILDFVMESHDALDKSDIVQVDYPFHSSQWPCASCSGIYQWCWIFSQVISLLSSGCF